MIKSSIYIISLFFLFLIISGKALSNDLPDLGSPDLIEYDSATEKKLGRAFTYALHTQYKLYDDLETNNYIRQIGHRLASYTGSNRNFSFYIIDDPNINAFAGPDGVIGIHTGLISAVENEDELAAVIAHEISHVTQNHLSRRYEYASTQGSVNSIASLIAAILIGMHDPNAGMAALLSGMSLNMQNSLKNSRLHETEADSIGIKLLHKGNYNPNAMGRFFGRLAKASQHNSNHLPEILRTHPTSDHRLAEAENRAIALIKKQQTKQPSLLNYIKLRLAYNQGNIEQAKQQYNLTLNDNENCYYETLVQLNLTEPAKHCLSINTQTLKTLPLNINLLLESLYFNNKNAKRLSNEHIKYARDLNPDDISLTIRYSRILSLENKTLQSIQLLENKVKDSRYKFELYKELAERYNETEQEGYAYFSLARSYLTIGNAEKSKHFLEKAKNLNNTENDNLLNALKKFMEENRKLLEILDK